MVRVMPSFIKPLPFKFDRNRNLTLNRESPLFQLPSQGQFVDCLKQAGAKILMQVNRTIHDQSAYLVLMHLRVSVTL